MYEEMGWKVDLKVASFIQNKTAKALVLKAKQNNRMIKEAIIISNIIEDDRGQKKKIVIKDKKSIYQSLMHWKPSQRSPFSNLLLAR